MPTYRADLDRLAAGGCQSPGCDHSAHDNTVFLHARCHPSAPTYCSYEAGSGVLRITCSVCRKPVASVAVASALEK